MHGDGNGRQRVLVVDDTPENIHLLMEVLRCDYAVMVATDGERALKLAASEPGPDIILLDISMPGMDGYEVCARLQADRKTASIPVVFLTARSSQEDEHKGLELGAVDYIHKPFIPALVKTRINNHLALKRHQEHLEELVKCRTAELSAALAAAQAASHAKSTFLATMSHELRTPLNSIIGFSDLVHRRQCGPLTPEQEEYLGYVLENGRHLLTIINTILDFSKAEAGKIRLEPTLADIGALVDTSMHIVKEGADRRGIALRTELAGNLPAAARLDPQRMIQVLVNLLSNAVKFTPAGGTVTLGVRVGGGSLFFSVRDTGIGIKAEDLVRIFEPFFQADNSATRRHEGTGLGLALAKMLVELHDGVIWAESKTDGTGSVFHVALPLTEPTEVAHHENPGC